MEGFGNIVATSLVGVILIFTIFGTLLPLFTSSIKKNVKVIQDIQELERRKTQSSISILNSSISVSAGYDNMTFWLLNDGKTKLFFTNLTEYFLYREDSRTWVHIPSSKANKTFMTSEGHKEIVNPNILDPEEILILNFVGDYLVSDAFYRFKVVTNYGSMDSIGFST